MPVLKTHVWAVTMVEPICLRIGTLATEKIWGEDIPVKEGSSELGKWVPSDQVEFLN